MSMSEAGSDRNDICVGTHSCYGDRITGFLIGRRLQTSNDKLIFTLNLVSAYPIIGLTCVSFIRRGLG